MRILLPLAVTLLRIDSCVPFHVPHSLRTQKLSSALTPNCLVLAASKKRDNNEDDEAQSEPGMAEAFRQLEALESLGDNNKENKATTPSRPSIDAKNVTITDVSKAPPEKQVQVYKEMVQELESTDQEDLYATVLKDMGGSPTSSKKEETTSTTPSVLSDSDDEPSETGSTEDFMNQALDEALKEIKLKNPSSVDSILDDKEIMKEIEAIFERGSEQLIQSLDEMRIEQVRLV